MKDNNWDLINGDVAHTIEYINYGNQVNVIEALVLLYTNVAGIGPNGCPACPTPLILHELHRTGTLFLLAQPGAYRVDYEVNLVKEDGTVMYDAPPSKEVEEHMSEFYNQLNEMWPVADAISVAAFALWKVNWVHPFRNGNGRTARAFAYACLCLKLGFFLPGFPTVLDAIMTTREPYEQALRIADRTHRETGTADLTSMRAYLTDLLTTQLNAVPA